jgi:hypothetical protein
MERQYIQEQFELLNTEELKDCLQLIKEIKYDSANLSFFKTEHEPHNIATIETQIAVLKFLVVIEDYEDAELMIKNTICKKYRNDVDEYIAICHNPLVPVPPNTKYEMSEILNTMLEFDFDLFLESGDFEL